MLLTENQSLSKYIVQCLTTAHQGTIESMMTVCQSRQLKCLGTFKRRKQIDYLLNGQSIILFLKLDCLWQFISPKSKKEVLNV